MSVLSFSFVHGAIVLPGSAADTTDIPSGATDSTAIDSTAIDTSARDTLQDWRPPWYDPATDDWRRVSVSAPDTPADNESLDIDAGGFTTVIAWILLVVILVVVIVIIIMMIIDSRRTPPSLTEQPRGPIVADPAALQHLPVLITADTDPLAQARDAMSKGAWQEAIIWWFVYLLIMLDRHQCILLKPGLTNRACVRACERTMRAHPAWSAGGEVLTVLRDTVLLFERSVFGQEQVSEAQARATEAAVLGAVQHLALRDGRDSRDHGDKDQEADRILGQAS